MVDEMGLITWYKLAMGHVVFTCLVVAGLVNANRWPRLIEWFKRGVWL